MVQRQNLGIFGQIFFLKKKDIIRNFSRDFKIFWILFVNFPNERKCNANFGKFKGDQIENFEFFSGKPESMKSNLKYVTKIQIKF